MDLIDKREKGIVKYVQSEPVTEENQASMKPSKNWPDDALVSSHR